MRRPTVSSHLFNELLRIVEQRGIDTTSLLKQHDLSSAAISDIDARIPVEMVAKIYDSSANLLQDPIFGLYKGMHSTPFSLGFIMNIIMNSPDVESAFKYSTRYLSIFSEEFDFEKIFTTEYFGLAFKPHANIYTSYHQVYAAIAHVLALLKWLYGEDSNLAIIEFASAPHSEPENYAKELGLTPKFNAEKNAIYLPRKLLEQPLPWHGNKLENVLLHADKKIQDIFDKGSIESQVKKIISEKIFMNNLSIDIVAGELNITKRTLQRRLKDNNLIYRQLLDEVKKDLAYKLLISKEHQNKSLFEIAFTLGYSDISMFHKHFKRWSGMPPGKYREKHSS